MLNYVHGEHVSIGSQQGFEDFLLRHCKKRLAFCLSVFGFVSPPIGQTLANDASYRFCHALGIAHAEG